jgi:hypothetical protein
MRKPAYATAAAVFFVPHIALSQVPSTGTTVTGVATTVGSTVTGVAGTGGTTVSGVATTVGSPVSGVAGPVGSTISGVGGTVGGTIGGLGGVVGGATGTVGGLVGGASGAVGGAAGGVGGLGGGGAGGISGAGGLAGGGAAGVGSGAGPVTTASLPSAAGTPSGATSGLSVPSISLPAALAPCDDLPRRPEATRRNPCGPRYTALFAGIGQVSGTREDVERFRAPLVARGGTPQQIVHNCREAIVAAALPYGVVRVDAASAGPMRSASGGFAAPVEFRVVYNRQGGLETRQATINCRLNMAGRVIAAA